MIWLGWTSNCWASSASVFSPLTAAKATFALKAGVWFRRGRLLIVSPALQPSWPPSGRDSTYPTCSKTPSQLFDLSKPPITFVQQALAALPERTGLGSDGKRYVTFFGEAVGFIVNYTPDQALRCDLDGQPQEVLSKAYRPGEVGLAIGGRPVSPTVIARLLGTT